MKLLLPLFLTVSLVLGTVTFAACSGSDDEGSPGDTPQVATAEYPRIASWLAKKDEIMESGRPYSLVMSGMFMPDEAERIRAQNPNVKLLAGLTVNWVWQNEDWMTFLTTVANYGRNDPIEIVDSMYLTKPDGSRCPFGWASEAWGQEEIYAIDPRNTQWVEFITNFYETLLDMPQHDGIIVDMVMNRSWCPDAISDSEWVQATRAIMEEIQRLNNKDKLVIFNSGRNLSEIDQYADFMDGYVMENLMGNQIRSTYEEALAEADNGYLVVYAVDTDDTGQKDLNKMRLGLTLSLLNDNTYFTYDFGPRDHGQAWWFPEYDANLGSPSGAYYEQDGAYWRAFENGLVVSSPKSDVTVTLDVEHTDVSTGEVSTRFEVARGNGRIFVR